MTATLFDATRPHVDSPRNALRPPSLVTVVALIGLAACVTINVANAQQVAGKNGVLTGGVWHVAKPAARRTSATSSHGYAPSYDAYGNKP